MNKIDMDDVELRKESIAPPKRERVKEVLSIYGISDGTKKYKQYTLNHERSTSIVTRGLPDACHFGESIFILFRWEKSVYKMIWKHTLVYLAIYMSLSVMYHFFLTEMQQKTFEEFTEYCYMFTRASNWMIMLAFFTNTGLQRLFAMQMMLPGTSKVTTAFLMSLKTDLPEGPYIVEQYARWVLLVWILTFRVVCKPLRDKYPNLRSIRREGILLEQEERLLEQHDAGTPSSLTVIHWLILLLKESIANDRFINKSSYNKNVEALMVYKKNCSNVYKFAYQNIPYAVVQAVIIVAYCFGLITAMARNLPEYKRDSVRNLINFFPLLPYLQFFVFVAWLNFGKAAVNPFGDDDTDINITKLAESHIKDYHNIKELYSKKLEDIFDDLPQKLLLLKANVEKTVSSSTQTEDACYN